MLRKEAKWIGSNLQSYSANRSSTSLLNIGSSTTAFRTSDQPYIDKWIFQPLLQDPRVSIIHQDLKAAAGVDIVGDITDSSFAERLISLNCDTLLVSNLLEHVQDIPLTVANLIRITPIDGNIFVTGPVDFPYHPDPIDNMFRPSRTELEALFHGLHLVQYSVVKHLNQVTGTQSSLPRKVLSVFRDMEQRCSIGRKSHSLQRHLKVSAFCAQFYKSKS